jgi:hypothetical protein
MFRKWNIYTSTEEAGKTLNEQALTKFHKEDNRREVKKEK